MGAAGERFDERPFIATGGAPAYSEEPGSVIRPDYWSMILPYSRSPRLSWTAFTSSPLVYCQCRPEAALVILAIIVALGGSQIEPETKLQYHAGTTFILLRARRADPRPTGVEVDLWKPRYHQSCLKAKHITSCGRPSKGRIYNRAEALLSEHLILLSKLELAGRPILPTTIDSHPPESLRRGPWELKN